MIKGIIFSLSVTLGLLVISPQILAIDLAAADDNFENQQYDLAFNAYTEAAERGNSYAYYRLANMYLKGLGTPQDSLNGILYFALAAEDEYGNAQTILDKILTQLPPENSKEIETLISQFLKEKGAEAVNSKYFPVVITELLEHKVTFENDEKLENRVYDLDVNFELSLTGQDDAFGDAIDEQIDAFDDVSAEETDIIAQRNPTQMFVLDHDIYVDGSVRHYREVQAFENSVVIRKRLIENFTSKPLAKPLLDGRPVEFVNRSYMGTSTFNKFHLYQEAPRMYGTVIQHVKSLESNTSLQGQFEYAMTLMNIPWLTQEEDEAEQRLLGLANIGHPGAMYEYGMLLYREQENIDVAIRWISEAAKYGIPWAEYRLGKILQSSPWVEYDEKKALFWFESAAAKDFNSAKIRAADIKLRSKNIDLIDVFTANRYLEELQDSESQNPEYVYLLAQSLLREEDKDFKTIFKTYRKAISLGEFIDWDVSEWQDELDTLLRGNISITEEGNCSEDPTLCS